MASFDTATIHISASSTLATTYQQAGVSIEEGDRFVRLIKENVRSTFTKRVLGDIGGFGGLFDARFRNLSSPVLVSSIDGVGTKLLVAQMAGIHDTVGQDLVNHCVNDILVCGARPLFFLDYFATGKLTAEEASKVLGGLAKACRENGCALIGGETAEMPGMYRENEYDLCGTIVGVVEKKGILSGARVKKGDVLVGLPSTGLHTNGFSLARAVLLKEYRLDQQIDELGQTLAGAMLAVHRSYLSVVSPFLEKRQINAMAHITGGGIVGNTIRVTPKGRKLKVDWDAWQRPAIFHLIQRLGDVPEEDMRKTFNLGIGLVMIMSKSKADRVLASLRKAGEHPQVIGEIG